MVMLDGGGRPRTVIETLELTQNRFDEVDELFAFEEGEGDRTLGLIGGIRTGDTSRRRRQFSEDILLWCERFRVVERIASQEIG